MSKSIIVLSAATILSSCASQQQKANINYFN